MKVSCPSFWKLVLFLARVLARYVNLRFILLPTYVREIETSVLAEWCSPSHVELGKRTPPPPPHVYLIFKTLPLGLKVTLIDEVRLKVMLKALAEIYILPFVAIHCLG